jgi:hypothetical protein
MSALILWSDDDPFEALVEITIATRTKDLALAHLWQVEQRRVERLRPNARYHVRGKEWWRPKSKKDDSMWSHVLTGRGGGAFPFWFVEIVNVEAGPPAPFLDGEHMRGWKAYA